MDKILVFGGGAVGVFYAWNLKRAGCAIDIVCRSNYYEAQDQGFIIHSEKETHQFYPDTTLSTLDEYSGAPDYILITTKASQNEWVSNKIQDLCTKENAIVIIQNGFNNEIPFINNISSQTEIIRGIPLICVSQKQPAIVKHHFGGKIILGSYPKSISKKARTLSQLFSKVNVPCETTIDIKRSIWYKLIGNISLNPVSVLGGKATTLQITQCEKALSLLRTVMEEACILAKLEGYSFSGKELEELIRHIPNFHYQTSMLKDYDKKRPMELEVILGNAIRFADEHKVDIPNIRCFYHLLSLAEYVNFDQVEG